MIDTIGVQFPIDKGANTMKKLTHENVTKNHKNIKTHRGLGDGYNENIFLRIAGNDVGVLYDAL